MPHGNIIVKIQEATIARLRSELTESRARCATLRQELHTLQNILATHGLPLPCDTIRFFGESVQSGGSPAYSKQETVQASASHTK